MKNQSTKLDKAVKISIVVGILLVAISISYYFISVLSSQNKIKNEDKKQASEPVAVGDQATCNRTEPYQMPEEIKRALSLRKQRLAEGSQVYGNLNLILDFDRQYENCYNIQYGDLRMIGGADGAFWIDEKVSDSNNLKITIDNVYKFNDDLLLAIVIQHELAHAAAFINNKNKSTCLESEQLAFMMESILIKNLNQGEKDSLLERLIAFRNGVSFNKYSENFFSGLEMLLTLRAYSIDVCDTIINRDGLGSNNEGKYETIEQCQERIEYRKIKEWLEKVKYCEK